MTRKDYILIAEVLRIQYINSKDDVVRQAIVNTIAADMADSLSSSITVKH